MNCNISPSIFFAILLSVSMAGCSKSGFLDTKPDDSLVVPSTLNDLQSVLDNDRYMNGSIKNGNGGPNPALGEIASDDYYAVESRYNSVFTPLEKNAYTWEKEVFGSEDIADWVSPYFSIFYANVALDGLTKITRTSINAEQWDNIKGSALFYRSFAFYQLSQVFAPLYKANAPSGLGIPLRLTSDINEPISRVTLAETYKRITSDLQEAGNLLPAIPLYKTRPSKPAVAAALARISLALQDYTNALRYATTALQQFGLLIDLNSLNSADTYPFSAFNNETIFYSLMTSQPIFIMNPFYTRVDSTLYASYETNDLRKSCYFKAGTNPSGAQFKGSYSGSGLQFVGLAADELYLIKAECEARAGETTAAISTLNALLVKRWKTGTFVPLSATSPASALKTILTERRKELLMRGLRWTDLRRLNDEGHNIVLRRFINGLAYQLLPGDNRYVFPIPPNVISFNPATPQNPR